MIREPAWVTNVASGLSEWFYGLFTWTGLSYLTLGFVVSWGWQCGKAMVKRRKIEFRWNSLVYIACALVIAWVMVETREANQCIQEFNQALRVRSQITQENDRLSIQQREIIYGWMHALVFPPPHIAQLSNSDPKRQQWAVQLTLDTDEVFKKSLEQQRENDEKRAANPLPAPTCGE
jgi:hypothetical protein